jgi:hypothetical protein
MLNYSPKALDMTPYDDNCHIASTHQLRTVELLLGYTSLLWADTPAQAENSWNLTCVGHTHNF